LEELAGEGRDGCANSVCGRHGGVERCDLAFGVEGVRDGAEGGGGGVGLVEVGDVA
jgi:hypothetical protein